MIRIRGLSSIQTATRVSRSLLFAAAIGTSFVFPVALHAQSPSSAQLDSLRIQLDRAVLAMDTTALVQSESVLDRALLVFPNDARILHYRGYAAYRRAVLAFMNGQTANAGNHLENAARLLAKSAQALKWPETYMLQATVAGMLIGVDQSRAMDLSQAIGTFAAQATAAGANNPRVLLLQAYGARNTPVEYGGGMDRAKSFVQRAMTAFATDKPEQFAPSWGREEAIKLAHQLGAAPGN